jgi:hypothetical protein
MALKLVNQSGNALGQFDGKDDEVLTLKGGEVVTFGNVQYNTNTTTYDLSAYDNLDGYVNPSGTQKRTYVKKASASTDRPLMLADDGISGYGTLFGSVVGGTVGQATTGAVLGPHTATGSGKVTCWHLPGVYAVSLDAVDTAATGLVPTNTAIGSGQGLTFTSGGLLTPTGSANAVSGAPVVGRFIDFETNGSLVTTPNKLVKSLTDPRSFSYALFYFNPPSA